MPKRTWVKQHHRALQVESSPQQNFVEVEADFRDLEEKVQQLLDDPERARRMASNKVEAFRDRSLIPATQACYWRMMLRAWAEVSFTPDLWEMMPPDSRKRRGTRFETLTCVTLQLIQFFSFAGVADASKPAEFKQ